MSWQLPKILNLQAAELDGHWCFKTWRGPFDPGYVHAKYFTTLLNRVSSLIGQHRYRWHGRPKRAPENKITQFKPDGQAKTHQRCNHVGYQYYKITAESTLGVSLASTQRKLVCLPAHIVEDTNACRTEQPG